jgi:hypothetical protein
MTPQTYAFLVETCNNLKRAGRLISEETDQAVSTKDHVQLVYHFDKVRGAADLIKEARDQLDKIERHLSSEAIPDLFREQGVKTITIEGLGRVTVSNRTSCSMVDKEAGHSWLKQNGHGGLIQPTVNSSSLAAFAKSYTEDTGMDLPEDIFKVSRNPFTSITKR